MVIEGRRMLALPFLRLTVITCICFLVLAVVAEFLLSIYLAKRDLMFVVSSWKGYLGSGVLWFISFTVALRIECLLAKARL